MSAERSEAGPGGERQRASGRWGSGAQPPGEPAERSEAGPGGERLAATSAGAGPRLVLVHGFTQTARSWLAIAGRLDDDHEVVLIDAPGHGGSSAIRADLAEAGELLLQTGGRATYVGYSMGARLCLQAALARPDRVERLVLVSGTAGLDDAAERATRRTSDGAMATTIERDGVDAFLARWLALPLFASLPADAAGAADRRRNSAAGLASSLRLAGPGNQAPTWDRLEELTMPVLVVAGAWDTKFVALAERLHATLPDGELAIVADAGHSVHLERPERFLVVLRTWLSMHPPGSTR